MECVEKNFHSSTLHLKMSSNSLLLDELLQLCAGQRRCATILPGVLVECLNYTEDVSQELRHLYKLRRLWERTNTTHFLG